MVVRVHTPARAQSSSGGEEFGEEQKQPSNLTFKDSWVFSCFSAEPKVISKDLLATRQGDVGSVSGTVCDLLRVLGKAASAQWDFKTRVWVSVASLKSSNWLRVGWRL